MRMAVLVPIPAAHLLGGLADLIARFGLGVADGNQQRHASVPIYLQQLLDLLLVEPADDAGAKPQVGRLQAQLVYGYAHVEQREVLPLDGAGNGGQYVHPLDHHRYDYGCLMDKFVHAQLGCAAGHLLL